MWKYFFCLDNKLSFIPHLKHLKTKCCKAPNLLKVVSRFDWEADRLVLLRLYTALVRSYIKTLDAIHHQDLRIATEAFRTSPVESLYVEADEESLYRRREQLSLLYTKKLRNSNFWNDLNINLTRVQTYRLPDIPVRDMKVPAVLYDLWVAKKFKQSFFLAVHRHIYSKRDRFVVCVDSRCCLQAIKGLHIGHPVVLQIL